MYLNNTKIIIVRFVTYVGVMLLVLGCTRSRNNDPNARYMNIVSEDACAKKDGYWYNNECWANVNEYEYDDFLTPNNVDDYVNRYVQAKSRSIVRINDEEYQPFSVDVFSGDYFFERMSMRYLQDTMEFVIDIVDFSEAIDEAIDSKRGKTDIVLFADFNESPVEIAKGQVYVTFTENNVDDVSTIIVEGTLVQDEEYVMNVYASIDLMLLTGGNSTLSIEGDKAYLNGYLGTETYVQIRDLQKHPEVKTLVLQHVPGSINDKVNLCTGRLVRKLGLITYIPWYGRVYSGGIDLFASGVERIVERGGELGIHAWCCVTDVPADKLLDTHPLHHPHIEYWTEIMGQEFGPAFYFRTIKAAPADDIYIMTKDEIMLSGIVTDIIDPPVSQ